MIICSVCGFPIMPAVGCPHSIAGATANEWREMSPKQRKAAAEHRVEHGDDNMPDKPKECPFCGGNPRLEKLLRDGYETGSDDPDAYAYFLVCNSCACTGPWGKNPFTAFRYWNMREPSSTQAKPTQLASG